MKKQRPVILILGAATVALLIFAAVLAPVISSFDPHAVSGDSFEPPSSQHLLGTNDVGQDIFSQIAWGARSSLVLALAAGSLALFLGVLIGAGAGLIGGFVDVLFMRTVDVLLALPGLPLLVLIVALAGPGRVVIIAAISFFAWPRIARIVRSQTLSLRSRGFVRAAQGFGGGPAYVLRRHVVRALGPLIGSNFIEVAGVAILLDAGLAFLGLGDPTMASWGLMLNRAETYPGVYYSPAWTWWVLPPGLAVTLALLGITFLWVGIEGKMMDKSKI